MAILKSDDLSFDFRYTEFDSAGWVKYQFYFRWRGDVIVNQDVLKKTNEYWANRREGAFLANEYETDGLIPLIKKVLQNDNADYWEALEPDIIVAIYPEQFFPFLSSHWKLIRESEEYKAKCAEREKLKQEKGQLPDDTYTFIAFVDAYNFENADCYYGQGLSLQLIVKRQELEKFVHDLELEFLEFKKQFKVDEWLEEHD